MASIVEKPATRQVVGFRAQSTTHCSRRITHFDCLEIVRNHSNVVVQQVLVTSVCHNTISPVVELLMRIIVTERLQPDIQTKPKRKAAFCYNL